MANLLPADFYDELRLLLQERKSGEVTYFFVDGEIRSNRVTYGRKVDKSLKEADNSK